MSAFLRSNLAHALGLFLVSRLGLAVVAWIAVVNLPPGEQVAFRAFPDLPVRRGRARFDSGWFRKIGAHGYSYNPARPSSPPVFPFLPLLVIAVSAVIGNGDLAGLPAANAGERRYLRPFSRSLAILCSAAEGPPTDRVGGRHVERGRPEAPMASRPHLLAFTGAALVLLVISTLLSIPVTAELGPLDGIGGRLVYVDSAGNLMVLDGTSGERRQLVSGSGRLIRNPVWSPDGMRVAFLMAPAGRMLPREDDIYVTAAGGGEPVRRVTRYESYMHGLSWFPDGQVLAFGTGFNGVYAVNRVNADGRDQRRLYPAEGDFRTSYFRPAVSPDGWYLASLEVTAGQVYVSTADGLDGSVLDEWGSGAVGGGVWWRPDGGAVLYGRGPVAMEVSLDGSGPRTLFTVPGEIRQGPVYAPDLSAIATVYGVEIRGHQFPTFEWHVRIDHLVAERSAISWPDAEPNGKLQWVAGGRALFYQSGSWDSGQFVSMAPSDGGTPLPVVDTSGEGSYDWHE